MQVDDTRYVLGVTEKGVSLIDSSAAARPRPTAVEPRAQREAEGTVTEFDRVLAASGTDTAVPVDSVEPLRRPRNHARAAKSSPLAGSILSPETWRQTAEVIRHGR